MGIISEIVGEEEGTIESATSANEKPEKLTTVAKAVSMEQTNTTDFRIKVTKEISEDVGQALQKFDFGDLEDMGDMMIDDLEDLEEDNEVGSPNCNPQQIHSMKLSVGSDLLHLSSLDPSSSQHPLSQPGQRLFLND